MTKYHVPADVPDELIETFIQNMDAATAGTGKMNLFACDQKIEHLNDDFYDGGNEIPLSSNDPAHLFEIGHRVSQRGNNRRISRTIRLDFSLCQRLPRRSIFGEDEFKITFGENLSKGSSLSINV